MTRGVTRVSLPTYLDPSTYFIQAPNAKEAVHQDEQPLERPIQTVNCCGDHGQGSERLTDPNSKHVELEQRVVDRFAPVQVHEEVVQETATPRRHGPHNMAPGQKLVVVPHQLRRNGCQYV